ncbi:MAG: tRNA 2-thiouridine(34) synthase MnmA [Anaerolineae bacterium]
MTNPTQRRVVVAMSGGVDSSVAAALLVEQGYEVIGLMLRLWAEQGGAANRCCTPDAVADARRVAERLDIPFYVRDYKNVFKNTVVDFFIDGYAQGITPNPCVVCNREVRFGRLLREALALDAGYLATGHYARLRQNEDGSYDLLKGLDPHKDQSYVLYTLTQEKLAHSLFPVGHYTKETIRQIALKWGLPVFSKTDSQDLCFLGDGDYRAFLRRHAPQVLEPGPITDTSGRVIGRHTGLANYTIGQRKGLGPLKIAGVANGGPRPHYVIALDTSRNSLVVGPAEALGLRELTARSMTYIAGQPPGGPFPLRVTAKIRYKAREAAAWVTPLPEGRLRAEFETPLRDITPGQALVLFDGDCVVGGGIIE